MAKVEASNISIMTKRNEPLLRFSTGNDVSPKNVCNIAAASRDPSDSGQAEFRHHLARIREESEVQVSSIRQVSLYPSNRS